MRERRRAEPSHSECMDADLRALWDQLQPLPGDLRLYGGTAMALYLAHRTSVDLDFATPQPVVDPAFAKRIPAFAAARARGGPGLVDLDIAGAERDVRVTVMECGHLVPLPSRPPITAANGVAVAHPVDLIASKMAACLNREDGNDYLDLAAALRAWPGWGRQAAHVLVRQDRRRADIRRALADPPPAIAAELPRAARMTLRRFAATLQPQRGMER